MAEQSDQQCLGSLKSQAGSTFKLSVTRPLSHLAERLHDRPDLPGAIITDGDRRVAVISRGALDHSLSLPYHRELFFHKEISHLLEHWEHQMLEFSEAEHIANAVDIALARPESDRYEPFVVVEDDGNAFLLDLFPLLTKQCSLLQVALEDVTRQHKARIIAEEKQQRTHARLLEVSRQAGMAEIATGVLHNVGNVLNSVNVSASMAMDKIRALRLDRLEQIGQLIDSQENIADFFTNDERGQRLPAYLVKLTGLLSEDREIILDELNNVARSIDHIKHIVKAQQKHARVSVATSAVDICEVLDDAVRLNALSLERHQIKIERDYEELPTVQTDRHLVLQILVNLISNAKQAVKANDAEHRVVRLTTEKRFANGREGIRITITDNGVGIEADDMDRIFQRGFTTRKDGHGFGLHNSANHARMLQGNIAADSEGPGKGASFSLELPIAQQEANAA